VEHADHPGDQDASVCRDPPARLGDGGRAVAAECGGQVPLDRCAVRLGWRTVMVEPGREAAAEVEEPRVEPLGPQRLEDRGRRVDRACPGLGVALLGTDVEGDSVDPQPEPRRVAQDGDGLAGGAAVLARQRPVRPLS
jgi:hypothetical protein